MARAEATWVDSAGTACRIQGMLEDKSLRGACVRFKEPIGVGSSVTIKWHREEFVGIVKYCRKVASDYVVGIERATPKKHEYRAT